MSKRIWETPNLEVFGGIGEKTLENAKLPAPFDGAPLADCPPGQYKMGPPAVCEDGQGGVS